MGQQFIEEDRQYHFRGKYFEDFSVGDEFYTGHKTITETDIVGFANLSGDWNPPHVDAEYAKTVPIGVRVSHQLLVVSIAVGLFCQLGVLEGTVWGFLGTSWSFRKLILLGDTIGAKFTVAEKQEAGKGHYGKVVFNAAITNQHGELVHEGKLEMLLLHRK